MNFVLQFCIIWGQRPVLPYKENHVLVDNFWTKKNCFLLFHFRFMAKHLVINIHYLPSFLQSNPCLHYCKEFMFLLKRKKEIQTVSNILDNDMAHSSQHAHSSSIKVHKTYNAIKSMTDNNKKKTYI